MELPYFARDLSNTFNILGLETYKNKNSKCKAWEEGKALSVKEKKNPHPLREAKAKVFAFPCYLKRKFLGFELDWGSFWFVPRVDASPWAFVPSLHEAVLQGATSVPLLVPAGGGTRPAAPSYTACPVPLLLQTPILYTCSSLTCLTLRLCAFWQ